MEHKFKEGDRVEIIRYDPIPYRFTEDERKEFGLGRRAKITGLTYFGGKPTYILNNKRHWHWNEKEIEKIEKEEVENG